MTAGEAKALLAFLASRYVRARTVTDELRERLEELDRTTWGDSAAQSSGTLTKDRVRLSIERSTIASAERLRALELVVSACVTEVLPPSPSSKPAAEMPEPRFGVSSASQSSELDLALAAGQLDDGRRRDEQLESEQQAGSDEPQFSSELDSVDELELHPRATGVPEDDPSTLPEPAEASSIEPESPTPRPSPSEREPTSPPSRETQAENEPVRGAWGAPERGR